MSKKHYSRIIAAFSPQRGLNHAKKLHHKVSKSVHKSRKHTAFFIMLYLLLLIPIFFSLVLAAHKGLSEANIRKVNTVKQLNYWQSVLENHSNYPDAYYQAALISIQLGEKGRAIWYLQRALWYDPYFKKAEELLLELKKK